MRKHNLNFGRLIIIITMILFVSWRLLRSTQYPMITWLTQCDVTQLDRAMTSSLSAEVVEVSLVVWPSWSRPWSTSHIASESSSVPLTVRRCDLSRSTTTFSLWLSTDSRPCPRVCYHYNVVRQRYFNVSSLQELFDRVNAQGPNYKKHHESR